MFTEAFPAIILIGGFIMLTIFGLIQVGGGDNHVHSMTSDHLNMFRPLSDPDFPWLGILFASPIVGIWYWWTNQNIVQQCLAGRNVQQTRRGPIFAAFLKLLPFF